MEQELRDDISEDCKQLILKSKHLIERSREIITTFQLVKQRCEASGLARKSKAASASSRHTSRLNQENHDGQDSRV